MVEQQNNEYRVIIAGGRDFSDYLLLREKCDFFLGSKRLTHQITVISGAAKGADSLGERYAREREFGVQQFKAHWKEHGKAAGIIRNGEMAKVADALIAFWDGESRGTANMIETARKQGLKVKIVNY